jgi:hypothetical protein
MLVEAQVTINGSKAAVWDAISDIENATRNLSGVAKIEVVERPARGSLHLFGGCTLLLQKYFFQDWLEDFGHAGEA